MYEPGVHGNPDGIAYRQAVVLPATCVRAGCTCAKASAFHPGYKSLIDEFNKAAYEYH
jgi:hypothetical protein